MDGWMYRQAGGQMDGWLLAELINELMSMIMDISKRKAIYRIIMFCFYKFSSIFFECCVMTVSVLCAF